MDTNKKITIQEIVVVEGKDDTKRLKQFFEVDTIETIGSAIDEAILERIEHAHEVRGVIVFTDPDFSGEKIRKTISNYLPEVKHAFISRKEGTPSKRGNSLGVEHASEEALKEALENVMTPSQDDIPSINQQTLLSLGLLAGPGSRQKREQLGDYLRIGYTNGKQLLKRLNMFRITEEELMDAIRVLERNNDDKRSS
ncbi:ribonuclease M5 [Vagococcus xieshaowenii]|uniref:Ribonuclease M5 n=1 Tax=Vagococcus xieshaowenii TaxID=2562451 RepID=A0AAJ5JQA1_9ENTE|nr:ribonuclease M5 [Vagococcus xieshaowenii]QCA28100.1 ribonuclease M5 [Vagococcus xieshaowenii]TFZ40144.1 ribonuclease M5 [Vagococcus xieshaowenii]